MATTTVNIDVQVQTKTLGELETRLVEINEELKDLKLGEDAFKALKQEAAGLSKAIEQANTAATGLTLEQKVRGSQGAVTALAGGLEATVGTLGLLGVESEVFGKFEEKALSAIAAGRGFIDIADGFGTIAESIDLASLKAQIFGKTTKAALISTGIGLFIVALGTVIAYWDDITDAIKGVNAELKRKNTLLTETQKELEFEVDLLNAQKTTLELQGKSTEEINNKLRETIQLQMANNEALLLNLQTTLERQKAQDQEVSFWESIKIAILATNNTMMAASEYAKAISDTSEETKETQESINGILKQQEALKQSLLQINKEESDAAQATADAEQARLDEFEALYSQYFEGIRDLQAESDQERLDLEKDRALKEIEQLELTDEERKKLLDKFEEYFAIKQRRLTELHREELEKRIDDEIKAEAEAELRTDELEALNIENAEARAKKLLEIDLKRLEDETTAEKEALDKQVKNDEVSWDYADNVKRELDAQAAATKIALERETAAEIKAIRMQQVDDEYWAAAQQIDAYYMAFDAFQQISHERSVLSMAAFQAEQLIRLMDLKETATAALQKIAINSAEAGSDVAKGFAATVKAGFPQNVPLLIAYAAQAAAIVATMVKATKKAKDVIPGTISTPEISTPSVASAIPQNIDTRAPQQLEATPITKTYVLTGDVTSGMEAEAKLNTKRTIG